MLFRESNKRKSKDSKKICQQPRNVQIVMLPCYNGQSTHRRTAFYDLLIAQIRRLRISCMANLALGIDVAWLD
jgi:hypothetical protein